MIMLAFTIVLVIMTVRLIMTGLVISGHHIMLILVTMVYYILVIMIGLHAVHGQWSSCIGQVIVIL